MLICTYVYMYIKECCAAKGVHISIYTYVHISIYTYVHISISIYRSAAQRRECAPAYAYVHIYMYVYTRISMCVYKYVHV